MLPFWLHYLFFLYMCTCISCFVFYRYIALTAAAVMYTVRRWQRRSRCARQMGWATRLSVRCDGSASASGRSISSGSMRESVRKGENLTTTTAPSQVHGLPPRLTYAHYCPISGTLSAAPSHVRSLPPRLRYTHYRLVSGTLTTAPSQVRLLPPRLTYAHYHPISATLTTSPSQVCSLLPRLRYVHYLPVSGTLTTRLVALSR